MQPPGGRRPAGQQVDSWLQKNSYPQNDKVRVSENVDAKNRLRIYTREYCCLTKTFSLFKKSKR